MIADKIRNHLKANNIAYTQKDIGKILVIHAVNLLLGEPKEHLIQTAINQYFGA